MSTRTVAHADAPLRGTVRLPGDKSVAHRAALLSALAEGTSEVEGYPASADPQSTLACLRALGVEVQDWGEGRLRITSQGLQAPYAPLDCGNSGTTMRLLTGILSGQGFACELTGDASLSARPMRRIADPLRAMGARIALTDGHAPILLAEGSMPQGITYELPVASAQVKSSVLLAGLFAEGTTTVIEPVPTRDHTERMLGLPVEEKDGVRHIIAEGGRKVEPRRYVVPGDASAAAFFAVAASIVPGSEVVLPGVGLNPSRTAFFDVLRQMGADLLVENERTAGGEPLGDLVVRHAPLHAVEIGGRVIPNLIDEIPALCVAAACAEGTTVVRDAAELRVKETDRIAAIAEGLRTLGAFVDTFEDGLAVGGGTALRGAEVESRHDHRIAMSLAVAALMAEGETTIRHADCAAISFPGFWDALDGLR